MKYKVEKVGDDYQVINLKNWLGEPNTLLIFRDEETGDVVTDMSKPENLYRALYDEYQVSDHLKDGDTFEFNGEVIAECAGVHVIPVGDFARQVQ